MKLHDLHVWTSILVWKTVYNTHTQSYTKHTSQWNWKGYLLSQQILYRGTCWNVWGSFQNLAKQLRMIWEPFLCWPVSCIWEWIRCTMCVWFLVQGLLIWCRNLSQNINCKEGSELILAYCWDRKQKWNMIILIYD